MILADTSAIIELLRGSPPSPEVGNETLAICTIVELELLRGAFHKGGVWEQRRLQTFFDTIEIFPFDSAAARQSAKVMANLWNKGTPIGDFDSQIAGHALSMSLPLLTANDKHFRRVEGLAFITYSSSTHPPRRIPDES